MRWTMTALLAAAMVVTAQTYRCDWNVVGIAGGEMAGTSYRCGSTAGQTVAGTMTGSSYQAFIGFWQIDAPVGIQEEVKWPSGPVLQTRLYAPAPNPARAHVVIRYSLAADVPVSLRIHDLTGRTVRTLCTAGVKRGVHSVAWNGADDRGRPLGNGVYFLKFSAGDYRQTEKLVVQR